MSDDKINTNILGHLAEQDQMEASWKEILRKMGEEQSGLLGNRLRSKIDDEQERVHKLKARFGEGDPLVQVAILDCYTTDLAIWAHTRFHIELFGGKFEEVEPADESDPNPGGD